MTVVRILERKAYCEELCLHYDVCDQVIDVKKLELNFSGADKVDLTQ